MVVSTQRAAVGSRRWATALAVTAALVAVLAPAPAPSPGGRGYIVQGRDVQAAAAAVRAAGGTVTHELGVIDAVGARLAPAQLDILRHSGVVRRVYAEGTVRASAGCGVASWASPVIHDNKLEWELTNHSATTVTLSRLEVRWPAAHGGLKKIDLAGRIFESLAPPPAFAMSSSWKGDLAAQPDVVGGPLGADEGARGVR